MAPKRFTGSIVFISGIISQIESSPSIINTKIGRAILREKEFVLDLLECDRQYGGILRLELTDQFQFKGKFTYTDSIRPSADVKVTWYENNNNVLLKGIWNESPDVWSVIIELKAVESF